MLTLTRSVGETIRIGDDIEVHVVEVRGGTVRLGFKAPREVAIHREEVYRQIAEANLLAAQVTADSLGARLSGTTGRRPRSAHPRRNRAQSADLRGRREFSLEVDGYPELRIFQVYAGGGNGGDRDEPG